MNSSFLKRVRYFLSLTLMVYQLSGHAITLEEEDQQRIADLVLANHIIADQGVVDGFGHISVRSARNPNHYFMSRSRAPASVTLKDIIEYDLDDHPINTNGMTPYGERFIHSEIYKVRPEVQSIIHSHSPAVIPFSVSDVPLKPLSNTAGFLLRDVPVFEIRDTAGPATDMLVKNKELGSALAKKLADANVVLMRGHGMAVVGKSIRIAVSHAVYTERNAQIQTQALLMGGKITYYTEQEALAAGNFIDGQVNRPWEIWAEQASAHELKH